MSEPTGPTSADPVGMALFEIGNVLMTLGQHLIEARAAELRRMLAERDEYAHLGYTTTEIQLQRLTDQLDQLNDRLQQLTQSAQERHSNPRSATATP